MVKAEVLMAGHEMRVAPRARIMNTRMHHLEVVLVALRLLEAGQLQAAWL